jgi:hypothetical protein
MAHPLERGISKGAIFECFSMSRDPRGQGDRNGSPEHGKYVRDNEIYVGESFPVGFSVGGAAGKFGDVVVGVAGGPIE